MSSLSRFISRGAALGALFTIFALASGGCATETAEEATGEDSAAVVTSWKADARIDEADMKSVLGTFRAAAENVGGFDELSLFKKSDALAGQPLAPEAAYRYGGRVKGQARAETGGFRLVKVTQTFDNGRTAIFHVLVLMPEGTESVGKVLLDKGKPEAWRIAAIRLVARRAHTTADIGFLVDSNAVTGLLGVSPATPLAGNVASLSGEARLKKLTDPANFWGARYSGQKVAYDRARPGDLCAVTTPGFTSCIAGVEGAALELTCEQGKWVRASCKSASGGPLPCTSSNGLDAICDGSL